MASHTHQIGMVQHHVTSVVFGEFLDEFDTRKANISTFDVIVSEFLQHRGRGGENVRHKLGHCGWHDYIHVFLWVVFKQKHCTVWRAGLYTPFHYLWTCVGDYSTHNQLMRM